MPVFDEKYLKTKVREYDGKIKTNFLSNDVPKENMHYTCIACIPTDSVMKRKRKIIHKFIWKSLSAKLKKCKCQDLSH